MEDVPLVQGPEALLGRVLERDHFLATDHGPVVIDIKPQHLLNKPTVAYTFAWTRRLAEARGWQ
ncbi:MAG TPA: hypothetical protein VHZ96_08445 [Frankiaceae bacterium]|jgi:hypothetical protein|nr:hypothetical protein [Frankiaceae bacterium]